MAGTGFETFEASSTVGRATDNRRASCYGLSMSQLTAAPMAAPASTMKTAWWRMAIVGTSLLVLWSEVVKHLSADWSLNPQYSYGWAVPFLSIFLLWQRWPERPSPQPPRARTLPLSIIFFCAFLFLPIRFVAEANPDWRLLSWALALAAVTISICFLLLAGGASWAR